MRSRSCLLRNLDTTSAPNVKDTPRSFSPQPCTSLSGSLQRRSQRRPVSGTSVGRMILRICSMDCRSGERPPWQQKIFSSIIAAMGKQLKQSVNVFHSLMLYLKRKSTIAHFPNPIEGGPVETLKKFRKNLTKPKVHLNFENATSEL